MAVVPHQPRGRRHDDAQDAQDAQDQTCADTTRTLLDDGTSRSRLSDSGSGRPHTTKNKGYRGEAQ